MPADALKAMGAIARERNSSLGEYTDSYSIRVNSAGGAFEYYIKDALTGNFYADSELRGRAYSENYAWLGNQNNPPDAIALGGDAFEFKKLQSPRNAIALNSSPPKDMLYRDDQRIVQACRESDGGLWEKKSIFYVVGWLQGRNVRSIYFVEGSCYAASKEVYCRISSGLSKSVKGAINSSGLEGGKTNELGRVNRVDPLGITSLRVRGMWQIENPSKVFHEIAPLSQEKAFQAYAIMRWEKYESLLAQQGHGNRDGIPNATVKKSQIPDPNNPAKKIGTAVLEVSWQ